MEKICDYCNGEKMVHVKDSLYIMCNKCNGKGYLDWIDQVVPNEDTKIYYYTGSISAWEDENNL